MSKSRHPLIIRLLLAFLCLGLLMPVAGQQQLDPFRGNPTPNHPRPFIDGDWRGEYTFARIIYDSPHSPYNRWFGGAWQVDYPEADYNFMMGIREWAGSNLHLAGRPVQIRPTDERLFDYPFAYIVEPGQMELSDADAAALREYLLRGGFLMLDDFHGENEWQHARGEIRKILPEYEIKDLPLQRGLHFRMLQCLRIGIDAEEFHSFDTARDHVRDRVAAAATYSYYFDYSVLAVSIH